MRLLFLLLLAVPGLCQAQVDEKNITRVLSVLSADSMMGRQAGTVYSDKAAAFIASEFSKAGLKTMPGQEGYLQKFNMIRSETEDVTIAIDGTPVDPKDVLVFAEDGNIDWSAGSAEKIWLDKGQNFGQKVFGLTGEKGNRVVFADTSYRRILKRFSSFPMQRFGGSGNMVVVLTTSDPANWTIKAKSKIQTTIFQNVVGMIPGKRAEEYVIFSGHYDHLGAGASLSGAKPVDGDSIYNGANDDASGTTAVIALGQHFAKMKKQPERTILFVAFTAEESGGYGSSYFSKQLAPEKVMAMFNIEMIGTDSKWGKNSAYITGFERTDFGKILQDDLKGTAFNFYPDPYPQQNLFFRSDNATLARLGVPAHTISTSKMDSEKFYHTVDDEIETLDMKNMAEIIKAIALSSKAIIDGVKTPTRVGKIER
ncbi:MAG TPA: M20/M25/M40 family metallo-hydrolase [Chitinophagaceae bacterium]|nr:M20/M25/M40 family metallo-hydrolase [Chitinophagaceae bacterium]